ncbi:hypothetical protein HGR01_06585 [Tolypothrix sp. PCC 7712]|nr:hypothetical protein HGR01_06585 [Tolypothrix sp. PCC 7712]UYD37721.1 hypothetical protein HG267_12095 [Tolypothrix sp. PCC 7601]
MGDWGQGDGGTRGENPITHYSLPITHYSLPITHYSLLITHYSLLITHYSLLITNAQCPMPNPHSLSNFCLMHLLRA